MQVLIIDDDVVSRMVLMHIVSSATDAAGGHYDVVEAEDGEQAWRLLDTGMRPAIVFCDLRMPHLSGMELLARTRADTRFAGLPFVLASAAGDAATMEQATGLGADGYIVKPFDSARVQVYLDRLSTVPAAAPDEALTEAPDATARRLGIDGARLLLYLGGLERQLAVAVADVGQLLAGGQHDAARAQLARLRDGCRMLGLAGAEARLAALQAQAVPDAAGVTRALEAARAAVLRQAGAARRAAP